MSRTGEAMTGIELADQEWERSGDAAAALLRLDAVLRAEPSNGPALNLAGRVRVAAGELERGLGQLREAMAVGGADERGLTAYAEALASRGRGTEAVPALEAWCAARPADGVAWNVLGWLKGLVLGDRPGALAALDRAVGLRPGDGAARFNRAQVLLLAGRLNDADQELRACLGCSGQRPAEAWVRLGELAFSRGQLRRALGAFRRASEVDQRGEYALRLHQVCQSIASVLLQQGRYFLGPGEDSSFNRQLERRSVGEAPAPLGELAARAEALTARRPELAASCAGIVRSARGRALWPNDADQSFSQALGVVTTAAAQAEAQTLAREWRRSQLALHEELVDREEPLPGRTHEAFEVALAARDFAVAGAFIEAQRDDPELRAVLGERLGDRLRLLDELEHARERYARATQAAREFASSASAGGEGLARMSEVERLEKKRALPAWPEDSRQGATP